MMTSFSVRLGLRIAKLLLKLINLFAMFDLRVGCSTRLDLELGPVIRLILSSTAIQDIGRK
jgi:hypothetical protein